MHRAWRFRTRTEIGPVRFVLDHVRPGQTVLDIGSNKGAYAYWFCRRVKSHGRVLAFEPQPQLADYVSSAGRAMGFDQLSVIRVGLSSSEGDRELFRPDSNPEGGATLEAHDSEKGHSIRVPTSTLDSVLQGLNSPRVDLIKCDVEGHEFEIFQGAEQTLRKDRPLLVFECQNFRHAEGQLSRVFGMLRELEYEGYFFFRDGRMRPLQEFDVAVHQKELGEGYIDNFAFFPAGQSPKAA